ncbi:hypothetical protein BV20DRAFT_955498, partial [Pilatotrama ljubarskyi]
MTGGPEVVPLGAYQARWKASVTLNEYNVSWSDGNKGAHARTLEPFILAALLMTIILHALAATARLPIRFVLSALQAFLYSAFVFSNTCLGRPPKLLPEQAAMLKSMPRDIKTALQDLEMAPEIIRYACC